MDGPNKSRQFRFDRRGPDPKQFRISAAQQDSHDNYVNQRLKTGQPSFSTGQTVALISRNFSDPQ
jgi:hypothetical protein